MSDLQSFQCEKVRLQGGMMLNVAMFCCSGQPREERGGQYLFECAGDFLSLDYLRFTAGCGYKVCLCGQKVCSDIKTWSRWALLLCSKVYERRTVLLKA